MPSLNIFHIEFDRQVAVYIPGEIVSGYVIIDLAREKIAEALKLSAKGEAYVWWTEDVTTTDIHGNSTTITTSYSGNEIYFGLTILLLEKTESDRKVHLPAGLSRYPFRIQLPCDIPCSFEHRVGHIRYTVKATIVRSWRFNHDCKAAFTIITTYDLNIRSEQCIGIYDEINQAFPSCCCCSSDGLVNVHVKLPTTGFVPGQWIEVILDLRDIITTDLQKICAKLQQSLDFHATMSTKNVTATVAAVHKIGPFDKHSVIALRLLIQSMPPSELEFCNIIHLKYILRIVLHSSERFCKIVRQYPILIGTIPLRPAPSAPTVSSSPHVYQSTSNYKDVRTTSEISNIVPNAPCPDSPSMNEFLDTPPSYEECCTNRTSCITDPKESTYVYGANKPFAPKYPVFKFSISHPPEKESSLT